MYVYKWQSRNKSIVYAHIYIHTEIHTYVCIIIKNAVAAYSAIQTVTVIIEKYEKWKNKNKLIKKFCFASNTLNGRQ